ncbi:ABC-three component system protein [Sulfurovum sp. TSL1]|uniref:ABC-three component system protein n=1 Tax=Sulfurovum sp. TSL1 TaxID=2826994 RepID=UPI001CC4F21D|nr:ABC-three component system protein [Sulfurovum sp. TSL1]GIT97994.1 hypothetical protein TSL1_08150 [Sulfurovum sp. TSL1]
MNFYEKCQKSSVRVDSGSGVLFQPMTQEYTYVLTAKHNLYNDQEFGSYNHPKQITDIKITLYEEEEQSVLDKYEHQRLDLAILKIKKVAFESPLKRFEAVKDRDEYKFYGYPENRREQTNKIKHFDLRVGNISNGEIIAENESYYSQDDIKGCSGGGVFKDGGDSFYLVGIENRMDAQSEGEENNQRLRFVFINTFDEIIEEYPQELEPLYPSYMNNFNLIVDEIFLLNDLEEKRDFIRDRLKFLARQYTREIKPIMIKKEFEDELLIHGLNLNDAISHDLWSMYLEFILLYILIENKEQITVEKIKEIYKKRKLIFAKADRWVTLKENILKSNLRGLQKGGTVFIACDGHRRPEIVEWSLKSILDITRPPQPEEMRIDQGIDYTKDLKYKHIYAIEKLLLQKADELTSITSENIDQVLKEVLQNVCN